MRLLFRVIGHLIVIGLLTVITQIGGVLWLFMWPIVKWLRPHWRRWQRLIAFSSVYLFFSLVLVPLIAPIFGRLPLPIWGNIAPQTYFTVLANRHYVRPTVFVALQKIRWNE